MLNIFTDNWNDTPTLNEGERMLRIVTENPSDNLYVIVDDSMDEDDLEDEIRFALRRKYGCEYGGYEDVSCICEWSESAQRDADEAWDDEGWYSIKWSDGGMDWTNDGPVWYDDKAMLATDIEVAYEDSTETHLPYAEKVRRELFEGYELDAFLGDFVNEFDRDALVAAITYVDYRDNKRYYTDEWLDLDDDDLAEFLERFEKKEA